MSELVLDLVRHYGPIVPLLQATRLVDEARIATLDVLGDGAAASAIAARWFRADG